MRKIFFAIPVLFWQCARQSQPAGGPKDTDPPELISSIPKQEEKNFKGKTIELTFNEFVKLKNAEDEIVITPPVGSKTKFTAKRNKVTIIPQNDWKDSTTYSIAFRDAVQDINEGNPAEDLHLAFSTGPIIDSLKLNGYISEVFTDKTPEKITVALYQSDTFDIFKHKPTYFTKTNKKGKFSISNLKAGKYYIYAFDDKNKNSKVDGKSERVAFEIDPINIEQQKDSIHLELVHVDARPIKITSVRNTSTVSLIRFNKLLDSVKLRSEKKPILYTFGSDHSELVLYKDFDPKDSIKIFVSASDSLAQKLDSSVYVKFTESKIPSEKFNITDWETSFDMAEKLLTATATTNKLLANINYDSIYIQLDSINYQALHPENFTFDTLLKKITLSTKLKIDINENTLNPVLLFGKGALITVDNDSTKSKEYKINIPKTKETGILSIEINTKEKNFEVQLLNAKGKIIQSIRNKTKHTFNYIAPSEYKLIVIIDNNNNHRWDVGNFYLKKKPERVVLYKNTENKTSIPIRANWEVGPLVITF